MDVDGLASEIHENLIYIQWRQVYPKDVCLSMLCIFLLLDTTTTTSRVALLYGKCATIISCVRPVFQVAINFARLRPPLRHVVFFVEARARDRR